jgi:hypothetical protein
VQTVEPILQTVVVPIQNKKLTMIKKLLLLLNYVPLLQRLARCSTKAPTAKVHGDMSNPLPCVSSLLRGISIGALSDAKGGSSLSFHSRTLCHLIAFAQQRQRVGAQRLHFDLMKINYEHFNYYLI